MFGCSCLVYALGDDTSPSVSWCLSAQQKECLKKDINFLKEIIYILFDEFVKE